MNRLSAIGAAIIAAFAVALWLGVTKPNPFHRTQSVWAIFDDPSTVTSLDRDVRIAGGYAGKVGQIKRLGDDAAVELILEDQDLHVARDARAELRPHLAFEGSSFIELYPGSPSAPGLDRHTIPLSHTRDYVSVDKVLRVADGPTREALVADVKDLAHDLGPREQQGLQTTFKTLPKLYGDLSTGARAAQGEHGNELAGAVRGLAETAGAVAQEERRLVPGMHQSARTFAALNTAAGQPLAGALSALPGTFTALRGGGVQLRGIVDRLQPLAKDLEPALRQATPALEEVRPLLRELRPVLADARPVVGDLQHALGAGGTASAPATKLLRTLSPSIPIVQDEVVPGLLKPTRLGPPMYEELLRGGLTMGFDGAISTLQTNQQGTLYGVGHGFRFNATAAGVPLNALSTSCQSVPESLRPVILDLNLCGP